MSGFEHVVDYSYPANFDSLEKVEGWAQDIWKQLSEAQHGFAEDFELALSQKWSFKTITGITNDVVADQQEDTLTLAGDAMITITGTAATDTITWAWAHLGIESLTDPGVDRIAFWDETVNSFTWLAPDDVTIEISGTTLQVISAGVDHGSLSGLADDDHPQYIKDSEFTQNSGVLVGTGAGTFAEETGATLRTSLGLTIGTNVQAWDADLDTYAGITPSADTQTFLANADFAAMMADLSAQASATFDWNDQALTSIGATELYGSIKTDRWLFQNSNTFIGVDVAGLGNLAHTGGDEGYFNTCLGYSTGRSLTKGSYNDFFGSSAGRSLTIGVSNEFFGTFSGYSTIGGSYNTFFGRSSGFSNISGNFNVALGKDSGRWQNDGIAALQTPENSIYLGAQSKSGSDPAGGEDVITNEIVIGYNAIGHGSHTITLGNTSILTTLLRGNVGIAQTSFGTNATKTLALGTGVAPTTSPADCVQAYSADIQAGEAAPHFRTEHGDIIKLYQQAHIADAPGDTTANNATTINAILVALENAGLLATS